MLRRAVEEKDAAVAQAAEAVEGLEVQMKIAQGRLEQSEVPCLKDSKDSFDSFGS